MASTYTTTQGDTWDLVSYFAYGDEKYLGALYDANWEHGDMLVFPGGIELSIPDLPEEQDADAPFWAMGDTDAEDYSETEDPADPDSEWEDDG